ncbi:MAG: hypothetical protein HUK12_09720 [Muribaculaceae bacterium]|nr:hypothetical protein [Muribaculaceae bacterium]MCF0205530.1 hypothetical protein [Muribaculaceae bacterium]
MINGRLKYGNCLRLCALLVMACVSAAAFALPDPPRRDRVKVTDTTSVVDPSVKRVVNVEGDTVLVQVVDDADLAKINAEILAQEEKQKKDSITRAEMGEERKFIPDPNRALWLSALCPGLGQIYNRRYWKLPIVVGGYLGLIYATTWNNTMFNDYSRAYADAMDNDPSTKSYMDFYPPTVKESDIDMEYLKKRLKAQKDYFRRNRDLCIIGMGLLYLVTIVDAYVDASLSTFDISPDLSMKVRPTALPQAASTLPGIGAALSLKF